MRIFEWKTMIFQIVFQLIVIYDFNYIIFWIFTKNFENLKWKRNVKLHNKLFLFNFNEIYVNIWRKFDSLKAITNCKFIEFCEKSQYKTWNIVV